MKFCIATNQTIRKEVNKKKETHSANNLTKKKKKKRNGKYVFSPIIKSKPSSHQGP